MSFIVCPKTSTAARRLRELARVPQVKKMTRRTPECEETHAWTVELEDGKTFSIQYYAKYAAEGIPWCDQDGVLSSSLGVCIRSYCGIYI